MEIQKILDTPFNPFVARAVAQGKKVVAYTCTYVPEPLISVDGLLPIRTRIPRAAGTPMADTYLSSLLCPYTRSVLEASLEGSLDFVDGWVFASSCDHLRRLYDNLVYLAKPPFAHFIDLPHRTTERAVDWFNRELETLAAALADHFGVDTSGPSILAAIERTNVCRAQLARIGELRKDERPPLTGAEFHELMLASQVAPKELIVPLLTERYEQLLDQGERPEHRARLMIVGSQIHDPKTIEIIESVGALVVADRFCTGSLPGLEPFPEAGERTLEHLARHVLRETRCPRMMEGFDERLDDILEVVESHHVHGVVIQALKFCDLWGVESSLLATSLRERGIPVLRLEREYTVGGTGQIRTRVQAFMESMGR